MEDLRETGVQTGFIASPCMKVGMAVRSKYAGRLLIVDDDPVIASLYTDLLDKQGYIVDVVNSLQGLQEEIQHQTYDAVLLDLTLERESGLDGVPMIHRHAPYAKILVLTGEGSIDSAVDAMRKGVDSYITKDRPVTEVISEVNRFFEKTHEEAGRGSIPALDLLIGESDAIQQLKNAIEKIKDVNSTVLILGESGTGKEVVARCLHNTSMQAANRFEAINCGAIPENLLESELFGYKKGAFTDAKTDRKGIFELCSEGTLLLDEIGDMPLLLQAKLLRVLQERVITPIGSSTSVPINTRVIAATHRNIIEEVQARRFREDLFFRLSVVVLQIPPLRERIDDIPTLVHHFLDVFNKRFNRHVERPPQSLMTKLQAYDWPGNVRQLQNSVERGVIFAVDNQLDLQNMLQHLSDREIKHGDHLDNEYDPIYEMSLTDAKQAFEKRYVENLLKHSHGNISDAARRCGRYRADIYRMIERYGINQEQFR